VDRGGYLAALVEISDALLGGDDRLQSVVAAAGIVRQVTGARLAPVFLMSETGQDHVLLADAEQRALLGEAFVALPVEPYVREPWLNREEKPVWGRDRPEAWAALPPEFRAVFGRSQVCVPIHADGRHFGAMLMAFAPGFEPDDDLRVFLAVVGRVLGNAVNRRQTARRERELGALEERRRLSEELHVDLSQQIAAVGLQVGLVQLDLAETDRDRLVADVGRLDQMVEGVKQALRSQMLGLRADAELVPGSLATRVCEQVEAFRTQTGLPVALECGACGGAGGVPPFVAAQLVRVLQEALANVRLHAQAAAVVVRLAPSTAGIRLEIEDDGIGFDPAEVAASRLGLRIMAERLGQVDGVIRFETAPTGGTRVVAEAPLRARDAGGVEIEAALRRG
jgi:signal transduction histidine kinase